MKLQGLLFDIDGTLIDSNDHHARCWLEAFEHFGKHFDYERIRGQIGKGGDLLVPDLLDAKEMRRFGEDVKKFRGELFKKKYMENIRPFPFVTPLFEFLAQRGVRMALASSSNPDEVEYYTRLLNVEKFIEGSTSKNDAKFSKPSPEIFQAALEQAGTDAEFTFVVGDTPYDILAAHRMALPVIAVLSGGFDPETLSRAEFLWEDAGAITTRIDEIEQWFD